MQPRWTVQHLADHVRFIIPMRLKASSYLILTIYVVILAFFAVLLIEALWRAGETVTFAAAFLPLLALAILIAGYTRYLIWNVAGREVVLVSSKSVVVGRQLFRFRPAKSFDVGSIRRIFPLCDHVHWSFETFWGVRPKSIVISDGKYDCEFGMGLDEKASESLVREIHDCIQTTRAQQLGTSGVHGHENSVVRTN